MSTQAIPNTCPWSIALFTPSSKRRFSGRSHLPAEGRDSSARHARASLCSSAPFRGAVSHGPCSGTCIFSFYPRSHPWGGAGVDGTVVKLRAGGAVGRSWRRQGGGAPWNESATWWGDLACVVDGDGRWEREVATSWGRRSPLDPASSMMDNNGQWEREAVATWGRRWPTRSGCRRARSRRERR